MRDREREREREREKEREKFKNFIETIDEKKVKYGYRIEKKIFIESVALEKNFLIRQVIIKKKTLKYYFKKKQINL